MPKILKNDVYEKLINDLNSSRADADALRVELDELKKALAKAQASEKDVSDKLKKVLEDKKAKAHIAKKKWLNGEYGVEYEEHGSK